MSSSFGPVNSKKPRHGECLYCFEENHDRKTAFYFESRQRMVGPVCRHRLLPAKRHMKQFKHNRHAALIRPEKQRDYWYLRALLPDYCGEPGERIPGFVNDWIVSNRFIDAEPPIWDKPLNSR